MGSLTTAAHHAKGAEVSSFAAVGVVLTVASIGVGSLYLIGRAMAGAPAQVLPFNSGRPPAEHALSRYHVRWYPLTLVFLAFDVEMLFMYPWAVVAVSMGSAAIVEMFAFLGVLVTAVLWAWREGALRWV